MLYITKNENNTHLHVARAVHVEVVEGRVLHVRQLRVRREVGLEVRVKLSWILIVGWIDGRELVIGICGSIDPTGVTHKTPPKKKHPDPKKWYLGAGDAVIVVGVGELELGQLALVRVRVRVL